MPKTRNVSRSQWETAIPSNPSTHSRTHKDKENTQADKENGPEPAGRAPRSHSTRPRTGVLGTLGHATTNGAVGTPLGSKIAGNAPDKLKTATRGKGKPTASPLKRKKVPLQDITSHFLPAPEPANRGEVYQNLTEEEVAAAHREPANIISTVAPTEPTPFRLSAPRFTSPLPPSSPPSPFVTSPLVSSQKPTARFRNTQSPQQINDPLEDFDSAFLPSRDTPAPANSNSDPFGFVALERRLKTERDSAMAADPDRNDDVEYDELAHIPVVDTSSPRPVRRLKRALAPEVDGAEEENADAPEAVLVPVPAAAHFTTPPTPHKDKQKRRRLSYEGHGDVFSPCSSSVESSPSPMKAASARKRAHSNAELGQSLNDSPAEELIVIHSTRHVAEAVNEYDPPSRNLRPRPSRSTNVEDESAIHSSPVVLKGHKKADSKARATMKKDANASVEPAEDLDLKWQRERQERVEYFKRLDAYEVEQEDVYLV